MTEYIEVEIGGVWYPADTAGGDGTCLMVRPPAEPGGPFVDHTGEAHPFPVTRGYYPERPVP